jgi:aldehyde:ferredoxin oxidoreductase
MHNRILQVDLSTRSLEDTSIDDELLYKYVGGRGLGVKLFTMLVKPEINPLSSDNHLVFTTDPVNN